MKRWLQFFIVLLLLSLSTLSFAAPQPPQLCFSTTGLSLSVDWTPSVDASSYTLYYAPFPYTGPDSIRSLDMGAERDFSYYLWNGASFYIAATASNTIGESAYSNIELFTATSSTVTSSITDCSETSSGIERSRIIGRWELDLNNTYWDTAGNELPEYDGSYIELTDSTFKHVLKRNGIVVEDITVNYNITNNTIILDGRGEATIALSGNGTILTIAYADGDIEAFYKEATNDTSQSYSNTDFEGTWWNHNLTIAIGDSNAWQGWDRGNLTFDSSGSYNATDKEDSEGSLPDSSGAFAVNADGTLNVSGLQGFMTPQEDAIIYVGVYENSSAAFLGLMNKTNNSTTYSNADLEGSWWMHVLSISKGTSNSWQGWDRALLTFDSNGNYIETNKSDSDSRVSANDTGAFALNSNGTLNVTGLKGFMSQDKNMLVFVGLEDSAFMGLLYKVDSATTYSNADFEGSWWNHNLTIATGNPNAWQGWDRGLLTFDSNGNYTETNKEDSEGAIADSSGSFAINNNGTLAMSGLQGFMTPDKNTIIYVGTYEDSSAAFLGVLNKR